MTVNEQVDVYIQRCDVYIQKGVTGKYSYNYSRVQYVLASARRLCHCSYLCLRLQSLGCRDTYFIENVIGTYE